jgi:hypothetical protein
MTTQSDPKSRSAETMREAAHYRELLPFILTSIAWFTLWTVWCLTAGNTDSLSIFKWFLAIWALCVLDLLALSKVILTAVALMALSSSEADLAKRPALTVQTMFWGVMKLACLGVLGAVLVIKSGSVPRLSLMAGLGTLVAVPLFGGFWWSMTSLKKGSSVGLMA